MLVADASQGLVTGDHGVAVSEHGVVLGQEITVVIQGQKDAGLLEAFPDGSNHIVTAARVEAEVMAHRAVIAAGEVFGATLVGFVHRASGENVEAGHEAGIPGALEQQYLDTVRGVPGQGQVAAGRICMGVTLICCNLGMVVFMVLAHSIGPNITEVAGRLQMIWRPHGGMMRTFFFDPPARLLCHGPYQTVVSR